MSTPFDTALLALNPLFFWEFEESSGTTAADASPHFTNGTIVGQNTNLFQFTGPFASSHAYNFDGSTNYVSAGTTDHSGIVSVGLWVLPSTLGNSIMISQGTNGSTNSTTFIMSSNPGGSIAWNGTTNGVASGVFGTAGLLSTSSWSFLVGTYDGTNWSMYVNGVPDTVVAGLPPPATGANLYVGASDDAGTVIDRYTGLMTRPFIFNYALTGVQVAALYKAAFPSFATGNTSGLPQVLGD